MLYVVFVLDGASLSDARGNSSSSDMLFRSSELHPQTFFETTSTC